MTSLQEEWMERQKEWNELFKKHRLSFVTQLPEHVADIFEGWKIKDLGLFQKKSFAYRAIFQKEETEYVIFTQVQSLEHPHRIYELGCLRNQKFFFRVTPLFKGNGITREEMSILKPFFEEVSAWIVREAIRMVNLKKEADFQLFQQEMKDNGVDHVIREKDGRIVLKIGSYTIPVGDTVPPKDE